MKVGVLLAAGASTRMGSAKATVRRKGESFAAHGVRALWAVCDAVVVVLGSDAKKVQKAIEMEFVKLVEQGRLHDDIQTAHRHGSAGLEEAMAMKAEAVVLMPVDHPDVKANTVRALGAAMDAALGAYKGSKADKKRFAYAVVPRFKGERGHPVVLSPGLANAVAADRGAESLSDAIRRTARLVGYLDVADGGVVRNRNTRRS